MNRGRFGRMVAPVADELPVTLAEQVQAMAAQRRDGVRAQHRLLGEAMTALENDRDARGRQMLHVESARRLGDLRIMFALGPALYGKVIPAVLPGAPSLPPAGER